MPFPAAIRNQALVASARHCCVCHRYKGVKVEVHHIVQEAQGGANDIENAITLCFDCHADAGHYNPEHPRGTKFSPAELRLARDTWHHMVRHHSIQAPEVPDVLHCRFLVCKSYDAFYEITRGDLADVPVTDPFLVTNPVREFQLELVQRHPTNYRHETEWGDEFPDRNAYSIVHPDVRIVERSSINLYPYFEAVRTPSIEEIQGRLVPSDEISRLLLNSGVPAKEISMALAYDELCANRRFQEVYRLRPLWLLYLAATNLALYPITVSAMMGKHELPNDLGYRPLINRLAGTQEHALPASPIPPGGTVLVPLATMLGPLRTFSPEISSGIANYVRNGQRQEISHADLAGAYDEVSLIGPAFWPSSLRLSAGTQTFNQAVHEFDLTNLYTISRSWEAGSCPHLFSRLSQEPTLRYLGELFAQYPSLRQTERYTVAQGSKELLIAELEDEETTIETIKVNGKSFCSTVSLRKGEVFRIPVQSGDIVEFVGYYISIYRNTPDPWHTNQIVHNFMASQL